MKNLALFAGHRDQEQPNINITAIVDALSLLRIRRNPCNQNAAGCDAHQRDAQSLQREQKCSLALRHWLENVIECDVRTPAAIVLPAGKGEVISFYKTTGNHDIL